MQYALKNLIYVSFAGIHPIISIDFMMIKVNGHLECAYLHGVELHSVLGSSHTTPLMHTTSRLCMCRIAL